MALPNLKNKVFDFTALKTRHPNLPTPPHRFESLSNPQTSFEHFELYEQTRTPRHQKSKSLIQAVSRELIKLEQDLDYNEMQLQRSDPLEQFKVYKTFFDALSQTIKFKDEKISRLVLRGVYGCERVVSKLAETPKIQIKTVEKIVIPHVERQDFECQCEVNMREKLSDVEYDNFKQLSNAVGKIKLSRISNRLEELYDNLNNLKTEIPSPTSSPDLAPMESLNADKFINLKLTVMRENITRIMKNPELKRLRVDKGIQTNIEVNGSMIDALESMNKDKELNIFKLRSQNSMNLNEKQKLEEALVKRSSIVSALEDRNSEYETEIFVIRKQKVSLEEKNDELRVRVEKLEIMLEKFENSEKLWKKEQKNLKNLLFKKQKYLQDALDKLYNAQVLWKVAEKKLKNIEKSYLEKTGEQHKYKDINIFEISQKMEVKKVKLQNIESEIEENKHDQDYDPGLLEDRFSLVPVSDLSEDSNDEQVKGSILKSRKISRNPSHMYEVSSHVSGDESETELKNTRPSFRRKKNKKEVMETVGKEENLVKENRSVMETVGKQENFEKEKEISHKRKSEENQIEPNSESLDYVRKDLIKAKKDEKNFVVEQNDSKKTNNKEPKSEAKDLTSNQKPTLKHQSVIEKPINDQIISQKPNRDLSIAEKSITKDQPALQKPNPKTPSAIKKPILKDQITTSSSNLEPQPIKLQSKHTKPEKFLQTQFSILKPSTKPPKTSNTTKNSSERPDSNPSTLRQPLSNSISTSNSSDLVPILKPFLPTLPETNSEASKPSPIPENLSETLQNLRNKTPTTIFQSTYLNNPEKIQIKFSNSTQSNFHSKPSEPNDLTPSLSVQSPEISAYVPTKFVMEEKKVKFKTEIKPEQSFFDQDTLSRSFDIDRNSVQFPNEFSWIATLTPEQQKCFQVMQKRMKESVEKGEKAVQCLLLDDAVGGISNEKFGRVKEKYKDVLGRVFDLGEIDLLPAYVKLRIKSCVKGHSEDCKEVCKHLKRVIELRRKIKGLPYPINIVKL